MRAVLWAALLAAAQFSGIRSAFAFEEPPEDTELGPIFLLSLGGKLYGDLWLVLDVEPPAEGNPAIPAEAAAAVRATWRCVTCHGWSYSGAERWEALPFPAYTISPVRMRRSSRSEFSTPSIRFRLRSYPTLRLTLSPSSFATGSTIAQTSWMRADSR